jgi:hypothetical protein
MEEDEEQQIRVQRASGMTKLTDSCPRKLQIMHLLNVRKIG